MAKVEWSAGIDSVSGALAKPGKDGQHSCDKMLLGTHRTAETTSEHCTHLFLRKKKKRNSPYTADEVAQHKRFAAITRAVAARTQDLALVSQDRAAFAAKKNSPGGKRTMKAYLWAVCGAEYDQQNP